MNDEDGNLVPEKIVDNAIAEGGFKRANDVTDDKTHIREAINNMWNKIGFITTECPTCSHQQNVKTTKSTKCIGCGRSYKIYPTDEKCRVVTVPKGCLALLHELRSLELKGKYTVML